MIQRYFYQKRRSYGKRSGVRFGCYPRASNGLCVVNTLAHRRLQGNRRLTSFVTFSPTKSSTVPENSKIVCTNNMRPGRTGRQTNRKQYLPIGNGDNYRSEISESAIISYRTDRDVRQLTRRWSYNIQQRVQRDVRHPATICTLNTSFHRRQC